jgi:hypothetical protein
MENVISAILCISTLCLLFLCLNIRQMVLQREVIQIVNSISYDLSKSKFQHLYYISGIKRPNGSIDNKICLSIKELENQNDRSFPYKNFIINIK